jgi:type VI secretion system secreted protein VgrG
MGAIGLPANKTQCGLQDHAGNEILMEGKSGVQDVRVHAVKDMNFTVHHDYNDTVETGDRKIDIQSGTHTETIKGDTKITITSGALSVAVSANTAAYTAQKTTHIESTSADLQGKAATEIHLVVGGSDLLMKSDGTVSIRCRNLTLTGSESVSISGGSIRSVAGQEHETKGAIVLSEGSVTNTVKGNMVMLNPPG